MNQPSKSPFSSLIPQTSQQQPTQQQPTQQQAQQSTQQVAHPNPTQNAGFSIPHNTSVFGGPNKFNDAPPTAQSSNLFNANALEGGFIGFTERKEMKSFNTVQGGNIFGGGSSSGGMFNNSMQSNNQQQSLFSNNQAQQPSTNASFPSFNPNAATTGFGANQQSNLFPQTNQQPFQNSMFPQSSTNMFGQQQQQQNLFGAGMGGSLGGSLGGGSLSAGKPQGNTPIPDRLMQMRK